MIWLVVLSIIIMGTYTATVCIKQIGIPASISATFYKLKHPYWFCASMWLTAGLLMPAILEVSRPNTEWMAFFACGGMFLVGAAPNFKDDFEVKIHTVGAILCIAMSQLWVSFNCPWCLAVWIAYIAYTVVMIKKHVSDSIISDFLWTKPMFWVEIAVMVTVYVSLLAKM
ncbi:glycosyl transferase [uncultured Parabacteroides sp.]|jgi:hypothetical protein|uniref:glycosyl transferase n=1 Tax=uncultured Parabacteroides sp. TaxID=512312 RepID=UPI002066D10A|nr:glycosyl transferase [uncultured Parabacteroides sp.]DAJ56837.1 MAG TPA: Protein of unknown function (DUF1360) [Caudoviricetes sp.]